MLEASAAALAITLSQPGATTTTTAHTTVTESAATALPTPGATTTTHTTVAESTAHAHATHATHTTATTLDDGAAAPRACHQPWFGGGAGLCSGCCRCARAVLRRRAVRAAGHTKAPLGGQRSWVQGVPAARPGECQHCSRRGCSGACWRRIDGRVRAVLAVAGN